MEYDRSPDFPSLEKRLVGRNYDDFWMLGISASGGKGRKFFDQLAHGSWRRGRVHDLYQTRPGEYLAGEPCHVPNPIEPGEGMIICERIDANYNRAEILLFDAAEVAKGPVARLSLRHMVHPGFHTSWEPAAVFE